MNLLKKLFGKKDEKEKPKTFGDLIKSATCPEDLYLKDLKEPAISSIVQRQPPMPGVISERCPHCGGPITSSTGGFISEYCSNCKKPYEEPRYG